MNKKWVILCLTGFISLYSVSITSAAYSLGDSGDAVKLIQRKLTQAGCLVRADGKYSEDTVKAVKKFQKKKHLDVDGVVGPATYKALTGKKLKETPAKAKKSKTEKSKSGKAKSGKTVIPGVGINDAEVQWRLPGEMTSQVKSIVTEAKKWVGVPYRFGGTTPKGFDCSGFIQYVFNKKGINLPRGADEQYGKGKKISINLLEPGDLVFFTTYESGVSHSGLYLGDGYFISATTSRGVAVMTMKDGYWHDRYIGAKRVL